MADSQYKNILVASDGSKATSKVLEAGIDIAIRNHAHLDILTITQVDQLTDGYSNAVLSDEQTYDAVHRTQERMEDLKQKAVGAGVTDVSIHIRFGNPKRVIAREFPKDHHNDLIVIGATGISGMERFMVGSVTSYVNRNALSDVMVVRIAEND
ncbi:universal stress protein [Limosilactobacillus panis]|uniref:Universal stress family protein n=1 Tax=Limosilactobacillus panis DSM 6035 TaxID=1423782 RepID=A0A0R1X585_9LACO|nr:universal stress protein [Limosilactobacillus panis]KRM25298.1 universal stress family protein [Limosilactobacillus panis DSM 6035]